MSDSLQPYGWQHTRPPFPSPTPRVYSNSCPIELVLPPNHLILHCPLLFLPSIFPSIRVFSIESVLCIRWPKYWSFSFNISPSSEYSGLIFFRMDWLDILAVQGTLKSLLQHHSSKASVLWHSAFFYSPTSSYSFLQSSKWQLHILSLLFSSCSHSKPSPSTHSAGFTFTACLESNHLSHLHCCPSDLTTWF